jgi:hypothetical protein
MMPNIKVGRYESTEVVALGWVGWLEPADKGWIVFVDTQHRPHVYLNRDTVTGAVLPDDPVARDEDRRALAVSPHLADSWPGGPSRKPPTW